MVSLQNSAMRRLTKRKPSCSGFREVNCHLIPWILCTTAVLGSEALVTCLNCFVSATTLGLGQMHAVNGLIACYKGRARRAIHILLYLPSTEPRFISLRFIKKFDAFHTDLQADMQNTRSPMVRAIPSYQQECVIDALGTTPPTLRQ